jgi:hypothetical protein
LTFPECPKYRVSATEWELIKDYSCLPDSNEVAESKETAFIDSNSAHIDIDILVILLFEGCDLTSEINDHLLICMRCRQLMVATVSDELVRWSHAKLCETRDSLFFEWRDAVELYATTLAELTGKAGRIPDSDLTRLAKIAETSRKLTALFRSELDGHIATHNC